MSRVEVNPVAFFLIERGIGGNLHGRDEAAEWRATTRGEEHHLATCRSECRGGNQVVARCGEEVQTFGLEAFAVHEHVLDIRLATLLRATEGFVLEGGDAARLVAW